MDQEQAKEAPSLRSNMSTSGTVTTGLPDEDGFEDGSVSTVGLSRYSH